MKLQTHFPFLSIFWECHDLTAKGLWNFLSISLSLPHLPSQATLLACWSSYIFPNRWCSPSPLASLLEQSHSPWHGQLLLSFETQRRCHHHQEVFLVPKLGIHLGLQELPVLTDTTSPLTLKCASPFASPECEFPERRVSKLFAEGVPAVENGKCTQRLSDGWMKHSKFAFSSS